MSDALLKDLHDNLWASLRHTFNTDRILLGVTYLLNFGSFVLQMNLLPGQLTASVVSALCVLAINGLIFLSIRNSKIETQNLIKTLSRIYQDYGLGKYFDDRQYHYYEQRYALWKVLVPTLAISAIVVAAVIEYSA